MKKGWKIVLACAALTCVICTGGSCLVVNTFVDYPIESGKLEARLEAAKEAGVPVVFEDLGISETIPESENAAPLLDRTSKAIEAAERSGSLEEAHAAAIKGDYATAARLLKPFEQAVDLAIQTSQKPWFRPSGQLWDYPAIAIMPEFATMKAMVKLIVTRARIRASNGDLNGAVSDLEAAHGLRRLASQGPALIGGMVSIALHAITNAAMVDIVANEFAKSRPVDGFARRVSPLKFESSWDWMIRSEAFWSVQTARNLDRTGGLRGLEAAIGGHIGEDPFPKEPAVPARTSELPSDMVTRAYMGRVLEAWTTIFNDVRSKNLTVLQTGQRIDQLAAEQEASRQLSRVLARILFPVFFTAAVADIQASARDELFKGYVGVISYRQRTGKWPASLAEAGLKLVDPLDGKPLRYRVSGSGFRIWSIGMNVIDDGGVTSRESGVRTKSDAVVMYPPEKRE